MPKGKIIASTAFEYETGGFLATHVGTLIVTVDGGEVGWPKAFIADFRPTLGNEYEFIRIAQGAKLIGP